MFESPEKEEASMTEVSIIGIDLAKRVFHLHGASADGSVVFRRKLPRGRVPGFLAAQPRCVVAMEACATSHYWGREALALGHAVRLIPPVYVKPFVKRQKNDTADAEAIVEAASRPTMRCVAVKSAARQAGAMVFRGRDLFVRQRTQLINALRGHLAEFGVVAPQGLAQLGQLRAALEDAQGDVGNGLPGAVREVGRMYLEQIAACSEKIAALEGALQAGARADAEAVRLQTMPGIGPVTAMAIGAFAPPMAVFRRGRDFAAWLGLAPRQHSTGGRQILGRVSKAGQRDIRRLLISGAMAVIRARLRQGVRRRDWLAHMLARKPRMLVAIALANKMARMAWAMLTKAEDYRPPAAAA
jgi:transposase